MTTNPDDNKICEIIERWMDCDLPDSLREAFCDHLRVCPTCSHQIEASQNLDLEIEAACRLFAVGNKAGGVDEVTVRKQVAAASAHRRWIRRSYIVAATVAAASVLAIPWFSWPTQRQIMPNDDVQVVQSDNQIAKSPAVATPVVQIKFKEPALAEPAISTKRFTFVRVFAVSSDTTASGDSNSREFQ